MKIMNYCQNCGHTSHCGEKCLQDYGESEKTVCCNHCRCELDDKKAEKTGFLDIDSFNGA